MRAAHQTLLTHPLLPPPQSLEEDVNALKEKLSAAQDCGKDVTAACSEEDEQRVDGELQDLASKWNGLNTDVYTRKHQLEDALLQLGGRGGEGEGEGHSTRGGGGTQHKGRGRGTAQGEGEGHSTRGGGGAVQGEEVGHYARKEGQYSAYILEYCTLRVHYPSGRMKYIDR